MKKRVLVLVADYPRADGSVALMYVHVRNQYYMKHNIDVTVLNFASKEDYTIDNIKVITLETYKKNKPNFDIVISHAANIRNHYLFLKKYEKRFPKLIFFFHGHEVLKINQEYPEPFEFMKRKSKIKRVFQDLYDRVKFFMWRKFYLKLAQKSEFIFVSKWLYKKFLYYLQIDKQKLEKKVHIIHNSVGKVFEEKYYDAQKEKTYDFITIRANMDASKYGVDIVNSLAHNNPTLKFLIIGKGKIFNYIDKAPNVTWINKTLQHSEMIEYLNQSKAGLLPTREDTQGVMTCEFSAFGLPTITSDIEICHEIFGNLSNVSLISNEKLNINLKEELFNLVNKASGKKEQTYFVKNTTQKEVDLIWSI